jgi:hypothetical protein
MAGAKVVTLAAGAKAESRAPRGEPLGEPIAKGPERFPIWVHIPDAATMGRVFRTLARELSSSGFKCDSDLQTEPHANLRIANFFEVFFQPEGAREPEHVGMVTLYHDEEGNAAVKMSHYMPGAADIFRKALTRAIEHEIGTLASGGSLDLEVVIRQQMDYQPLEARPPRSA